MSSIHTSSSIVGHSSRSKSSYPTQQTSVPTQHSSSHSQSKEAYYGHEYISKLSARFVTHLFTCPEFPPGSNPNSRHEQARLPLFIAYALHRTKLHPSVVFAALVLLQRLKARFPTARGSSGHRLFISAYMIASKVICDDTYSNKSWSIVAQGMFNLREINQMEREMCTYLDWELVVDNAILSNFEMMIKRDFRGAGPYPTYSLKTVSRRAEKAESPSSDPALPSPPPQPQPNMSESPISGFSAGATNSPKQHDLSRPSPPISTTRSARFQPPYIMPTETRGYVPPPIPAGSAHTVYKHHVSPAPITPDTPSPSHSNTSSPASSGPRTPQDHYISRVQIAGMSPDLNLRRVEKVVPSKSKMFAFAAPATW